LRSWRRRKATLSVLSSTTISTKLPVRSPPLSDLEHQASNASLLNTARLTTFCLPADHQVRWRWTENSVAFWDNRNSVHRVIPGRYKEARFGTRTTVFGERPYFDPKSEGREEREKRLEAEGAIDLKDVEKEISAVNAWGHQVFR
jgi:hypothetical protein